MLSVNEKKAVIAYRRQKAYDTLTEANEVAKLGYWSLVGNRLYYSVFHMASALLLDKGFTARPYIERTAIFLSVLDELILLKA